MHEFDSLDWTVCARALVDKTADLLPGMAAYLFLRHSQRESPASGPVPRDMPITALGVRMATELGHRLGIAMARPALVFHSPLIRCKQTAEAIIAGFRSGGVKAEMGGEMDELVALSTDLEKKMIIEEAHGHDYVNYWLMGFFDERDMEPAVHYGQRVVEKMLVVSSSQKSPFVIMVGHDDTILGLRGLLAGIPVDATWLPFLGGYWIQFAAEGVFFSDAANRKRQGPYPCWWWGTSRARR